MTITPPKRTCDICQQPILPGERFHPDENDDAYGEHKSCTAAWFKGNFGREGLS